MRPQDSALCFEKFPQADPTLTTQIKSVGEAMAIERTFKESVQKCLRSRMERGICSASSHARQHAPRFSNALVNSHVEAA